MKPTSNKKALLDSVIYHINASELKSMYVDLDQLEIMVKELHAMEKHHNKLFILFFNLHLPTGRFTWDNSILSELMKKLNRILVKKYGIKRMAYTWKREQNDTASQQHYHATLILDGSKINNSYKLSSIIVELWKEVAQGHVAYPDNRFYNLRRSVYEGFDLVVYRMSYHAKTDPVYMKPQRTHRYGTSRIRFENKHKRNR